jgi:RNA polymerase sigma-70 factor (TIGR02960 family)
MSEETLSRARNGDENAFRALIEPYQRELQLHCYRILGSVQDAEDLLQETMLAAWTGLDQFEGRSSLRSWLYRIATNRCLNALRSRKRRPQRAVSMAEPPKPTRMAEPVWLEPYPDDLLEGIADTAPGPEARYELRESVGLAFVAVLAHLPPRQRAAVVLRDALGFDTAEVSEMLGSSAGSVKGALQRARATLDQRLPSGGLDRASLPASSRRRELVGQFAAAVERGDTPGIISLLTDDAWLTMPPEPYEYQGGSAIATFLEDRAARRGANFRLVPTGANGQPAFGCYLPDPQLPFARAYGLMVLTVADDQVSAITWFADLGLIDRFGLPKELPV